MTKEIYTQTGDVILVDDEDYGFLTTHAWHIGLSRGGKYAVRSVWNPVTKQKEGQRMHRLLLGVTDRKVVVDHVNGNTLDNRRSNLRTATNSQNLANTQKKKSNAKQASLPKGVRFVGGRYAKRPFRAKITCRNQAHHLGYFATVEEASKAYCDKAKELFGEFVAQSKNV